MAVNVDMSQLAIIVVVAMVNLGLATAVYLRNRRSASHRAFAAAVVAIVCWLGFAYLSDQVLLSQYALVLNRLTLGSAVIMGACLLRFALIFPAREARLRRSWRGYIVVGTVIAMATLFTPLVVAEVRFRPGGTDVLPGRGFGLLIAWVCIGVVGCMLALIRKYRDAQGRERAQLKFLALGMATFAVSTVLLGLILPAVTGTYEFARFSTVSTLLLVSLVSYAMIKHRLMDVRLVVMRGAAYALLVFAAGVCLVWLAFMAGQNLSGALHIRSEMLYVLGSLAAVFAFQPIRRGIEILTDRFFYQRAYSPSELLSQLGSSMTSKLDQEGLARTLANDLAKGMRLTFAAVAFTCVDAPEIIGSTPRFTPKDAQELLALSDTGAMIFADEEEPGTGGYPGLTEREIRVLAPLWAADASLGAIVLGPKLSGDSYTTQDYNFLEVVVAEAAIAMRNAHLFDEKNQRVRELTALNTLAFALGSSIELEDVLDRSLEQVVAVTGADTGSILLLDDAEQVLTIASSRGIDAGIVASTRIPVGTGIAGWVAACNKPLSLPGAAQPGLTAELLRDDVASAICAPVTSKDSVIGVLSVNRKQPSNTFTAENMHVVTSIAGQLGMAIENARLYKDLEKHLSRYYQRPCGGR